MNVWGTYLLAFFFRFCLVLFFLSFFFAVLLRSLVRLHSPNSGVRGMPAYMAQLAESAPSVPVRAVLALAARKAEAEAAALTMSTMAVAGGGGGAGSTVGGSGLRGI